MSKDGAIDIMNGSNLTDKRGVLYIFLLYIKMSECNSIESTDLTYYQRNWDAILNRAKDYYENDKERLKKQARDKYRNLPEEEKNKKKRIWEEETSQYFWRKETKTKRISKKLSRGQKVAI